jgi:hypothetical protein
MSLKTSLGNAERRRAILCAAPTVKTYSDWWGVRYGTPATTVPPLTWM